MNKVAAIFVLGIFSSLNSSSQPDTAKKEIPQGVIHIRKATCTPYVKVEYSLQLSKVAWGERSVNYNGDVQLQRVPVYDSLFYGPDLKREYPRETTNISRYIGLNLAFSFPANDTPAVDTMYVDVWISKNGKIQYADPDTVNTGNMNNELVAELGALTVSLEGQQWGTAGGFDTPKQLMKPSEFVAENYCCRMAIIVSSMPLTTDQKNTRAVFSPFDIPLNCPASDEEQKAFLQRNLSKQ
ncbi:MAG: hypothetical protein HY064_11980 [Bacteroidetes bacterium]|nr:hypothetical protein [Bacteroidota bacterium]